MTGIGLAASFLFGSWTRASSSGKTFGITETRMSALVERIARLEQRYDSVDDKIGIMSERIAQMPTRTEMNNGFERLENKIEGARRGRDS